MKKIYIIISKTPTVLAKIIRFYTKTNYSHSSISLDNTCRNMISFGRKFYWNPFLGGLVDEGSDIGFFKHFKKSIITIIEMKVTDEQYLKISNLMDSFKQNRKAYSFNIAGMFLSSLDILYGKKNEYFCSQFVAHLLEESGIHNFNKDSRLVRPHDFANLPNTKVIYKGMISDYIKK